MCGRTTWQRSTQQVVRVLAVQFPSGKGHVFGAFQLPVHSCPGDSTGPLRARWFSTWKCPTEGGLSKLIPEETHDSSLSLEIGTTGGYIGSFGARKAVKTVSLERGNSWTTQLPSGEGPTLLLDVQLEQVACVFQPPSIRVHRGSTNRRASSWSWQTMTPRGQRPTVMIRNIHKDFHQSASEAPLCSNNHFSSALSHSGSKEQCGTSLALCSTRQGKCTTVMIRDEHH